MCENVVLLDTPPISYIKLEIFFVILFFFIQDVHLKGQQDVSVEKYYDFFFALQGRCFGINDTHSPLLALWVFKTFSFFCNN